MAPISSLFMAYGLAALGNLTNLIGAKFLDSFNVVIPVYTLESWVTLDRPPVETPVSGSVVKLTFLTLLSFWVSSEDFG